MGVGMCLCGCVIVWACACACEGVCVWSACEGVWSVPVCVCVCVWRTSLGVSPTLLNPVFLAGFFLPSFNFCIGHCIHVLKV